MSISSFLSSKLEMDIRKLAAGDINALHDIYEQTKDSVFIFSLRKLRNRSSAEDAMQETYLRIAKCAPAYRPGTNAAMIAAAGYFEAIAGNFADTSLNASAFFTI